jgi:hypothetical protein
MINQAIQTNDVEYVSKNWNGLIAKVWSSLNQDQINALNNMGG